MKDMTEVSMRPKGGIHTRILKESSNAYSNTLLQKLDYLNLFNILLLNKK